MDKIKEIEDIQNIKSLLDIMKTSETKNIEDENKLLKLSSLNINKIKSLPIIKIDENMSNMLSYMAINELLNSYKQAKKFIKNGDASKLKKEAMLHIKSNMDDKNKYIVDVVIKALEMQSILKDRRNI